MPRWLGLTSRAMSSTVSGTTPSHRDRKIKLLVPDRPLMSAMDPSSASLDDMRTDARGTAFHGFGHPAAKGCLLLQGFSLVPDNPLDTRPCILVAVHNGEAPMICATCHTVDDALTVE